MAPNTRRKCQICTENQSKYTCSGCAIDYCSVPCYKKHKEVSCATQLKKTNEEDALRPEPPASSEAVIPEEGLPPLGKDPPLRPLTSLNWPYVPDESAYPDPLKRDDPKALQMHQYEAIATSATLRKVLRDNPNLPALLTSIDKLRGLDREDALQRALGVDAPNTNAARGAALSDDVLALRALAEAVEAAVRGGKEGTLGLDWEQ